MWELLGSLFGAASGGSLIGAIGGFVGKLIEHKQELMIAQADLEKLKVTTAHELAMADKSNDTLKIEIEGNLKQAGIEATSVYDKASFEALKAGYDNDKATYATGDAAKNSPWFIFIDVCRGITRPFLTWGLDIAVLIITGYLLYILKDQLPTMAKDEGVSLLVYIVHSVIFLASTATTYWFASRISSQK
jgi:hypothetical protein